MVQQQNMNRSDAIKWWFATIFLIAIPALVHALCRGAYKVPPDGTFWIGPISTTIPYVFLTLLFLAHCFDLKSKSRRSAYCGAIMAWIGMMAFTVFIISHTPGKMTSTMGIAMGLTPFCYIPSLFSFYIAGTIVDLFWSNKWEPKTEQWIAIAFSVLVGVFVWVASPYATGQSDPWSAPRFFIGSLFIGGFVAGLFAPRRFWLWADGIWLGQIIGFVWCIATSPRVGPPAPIAFFIYLPATSVWGLFGSCFGAGTGKLFRRFILRKCGGPARRHP